ncbi:MAG TPA: hypothetical protein VJI15_02330 [Candidatus Nanoarchaeia archaeon]|nr:hypothetical protein [Candidatus Nanoarchaeia archaeon]
MTKISAIDQFADMVNRYIKKDIRNIRSKISAFYDVMGKAKEKDVTHMRNELSAFVLLSKNNLLAHLVSIEAEFPVFPNHLKETYELEVVHWELVQREVDKLNYSLAKKTRNATDFLRAVCARIEPLISQTEDEYIQLKELLHDWENDMKNLRSAS